MKKSLIRVASIGAVAALLATMAPLAQAASTPTYDATTDAPIYLMDGGSALNISDGTQMDWNPGNGVILTAVKADASSTEAQFRLPTPTGASNTYIPFMTTPGSERTPSAWKAWGDPVALGGIGALEPAVWPGNFSAGTPGAIKTSGGTFSMGVAYTDSAIVASTHVVKAYYVTINVDPTTGTWTFATKADVVAPTDITTTTTISAAPTAVEVGGAPTVLTATVSASKTVSGNVQFFEGTTSLGSVALSSGSATKSVVVGTAGSHTYTAKFLGNLVGLDNFLASTSATGAAVTATVPAVQLPPNAPSANSLNTSTANGATSGYDAVNHTASLNNIPASANGKTVNVFVFSVVPTYLGQVVISGTTVTFNVSVLPAGDHKMVIVDATTGDVLAWATFTKSDAATSPSISKTINADVATAGSTPSDGEFSIIDTSGSTVVNLTNPALVNGQSVVSGALGTFKVTDLRQVSKQGWVLKTDVAQFVKGTDTIGASALGIAPKAISNAGTGATAPSLGTATVSGSAVYPWNFATAAAGTFSGVSVFNADLVFTAPAAKPAGTYTSTLTLTLVSN